MGLFSNPLGHAGYPPNPQYATVVNSTVRAATLAEVEAGVLPDVYVSPATFIGGSTADFASPPPIGSVAPNSGAFTTLTSTGNTALVTGGTGTFGMFGATPVTQRSQIALTNSVSPSGTTGTLADFTSLTVYATDAAAIHGDIYQLGLALSNIINILTTYGIIKA